MSVQYRVWVDGDANWSPWVSDGATAGSPASGSPINAVEIQLVNQPGMQSHYRVYLPSMQDWQAWRANAQTAGDIDDGHLRAFQAHLSSVVAPPAATLEYRTWNSKSQGWSSWKRNGDTAGFPQYRNNIEAIEIRLV